MCGHTTIDEAQQQKKLEKKLNFRNVILDEAAREMEIKYS